MFFNTSSLQLDDEAAARAQKSQKERQRRERENMQINRLKQFLLDNIPNNPYKLEKADILDQTVTFVYSAKQNMNKMEENIRQQSILIFNLQKEKKILENHLKEVLNNSMTNSISSSSDDSELSPTRLTSCMDSLLTSPTSSLEETEFSSPEASAGLYSSSMTPHLPSRKRLLMPSGSQMIKSRTDSSVWHPWE